MKPQRQINLLLLSALLVAGGCYAYRGGQVQDVPISTIEEADTEIVVTYQVFVESNVGDDDKLSDIGVKHLVQALQATGATVHPKGTVSGAGVDIRMDVQATGNSVAQMLSGFVSGFTWALVPAYAYIDFSSLATVTARDTTKTYTYRDGVTLWIQLFLLFVTNSPDEIVDNLLADMMRATVRDMQHDGLLANP